MEPYGAPRLPGTVDDAAGLTAGAPAADRGSRPTERLRALYLGSSPAAARFQHVLLASDLVTLGFFLVTAFVRVAPWVAAVNLLIALALTADFGARCWIAERPLRHLLRPAAVADLVVIVSLLASALVANLGFLRVLRTLRLLRSYHVLGLLRRRSALVRRHEEVIVAAVNVVVFVFFVTAVVYVTQHGTNAEIGDYADALYFTVATLTTTGFGDVTLVGKQGRLLSVLVMVVGISLFVRLVQAVFRPAKVRFPCPACGLRRHEPDAVHCKHCGHVLDIPDEGD